MQNILNHMFPNGLLMIAFMAMFALGMIGMHLVRLAQPTSGWAIAGVSMIAIMGSLACYSVTIEVTEADKPLVVTEAPTSAEDRYNTILADNAPSNYGDDFFKVQQH